MPWRETSPMDQRLRFIADYRRDYATFAELCARYEVSRKTGYKWLDRYELIGPRGLEERAVARARVGGEVLEDVREASLPGRIDRRAGAHDVADRRAARPGHRQDHELGPVRQDLLVDREGALRCAWRAGGRRGEGDRGEEETGVHGALPGGGGPK